MLKCRGSCSVLKPFWSCSEQLLPAKGCPWQAGGPYVTGLLQQRSPAKLQQVCPRCAWGIREMCLQITHTQHRNVLGISYWVRCCPSSPHSKALLLLRQQLVPGGNDGLCRAVSVCKGTARRSHSSDLAGAYSRTTQISCAPALLKPWEAFSPVS